MLAVGLTPPQALTRDPPPSQEACVRRWLSSRGFRGLLSAAFSCSLYRNELGIPSEEVAPYPEDTHVPALAFPACDEGLQLYLLIYVRTCLF